MPLNAKPLGVPAPGAGEIVTVTDKEILVPAF